MWALRWLLLLGPIALVVLALRLKPANRRQQIGALFAFLYGLGTIFIGHQIALWFGWWSYGWDALMLAGLPVDIVIGGAILFGPALFLLLPRMGPIWLCLPIVLGLHGSLFNSLQPLVTAGPDWFAGVVFVFATAHIPAIYLAHWTAEDTHLPRRVALLAIMFGANAFVVLPSLIMTAMGGVWALDAKPIWGWIVFLPSFCLAGLLGLAAVQTLALQGQGTAIPLDPTKRLVRTGIYAYVCNPMQLSSALGWIMLGMFLGNVWVMLAAAMAWIFVHGMVRWHHRHDLLKRFPTGWPEYRANVTEWVPRWRPWIKTRATLRLCKTTPGHAQIAAFLKSAHGLDIAWVEERKAYYENPSNIYQYSGLNAVAAALAHMNFAMMLIAHAWLLIALGVIALGAKHNADQMFRRSS